jgi:3-hydroxybutyryl-CoA dehydrogenase
MMLGLNHPMGPLRLADYVGLDVALATIETLHKAFGDKYEPCPLLVEMVKSGNLGMKTGRGFYEYR